MWEGAARLYHEIKATTRVIVYPSGDYFASFWTSTEFLLVLWLLGNLEPRTRRRRLTSAQAVTGPAPDDLEPFWIMPNSTASRGSCGHHSTGSSR